MEHKVKITAKEDAFVNVPAALAGIKEGDLLVVSEFPDCRKYTKSQMCVKDIRFVADYYVRYCMESGEPLILCTDELQEVHKKIMRENGYTGDFSEENAEEIPIYIDQVRFFDKKPEVVVEKKVYSIHKDEQDKRIIEEMVSKVDRDRFIKLCSVALGRGRKPSAEVVDKILKEWAKAKYDFYLAFGRNLVIRKPIEFKIDESEMRPMVYELYKQFPMYAATLDKIMEEGGISAFVENKCPASRFFPRYVDFYKSGMKVSKFLSQLYHMPKEGSGQTISEKFDIEFSKVLQDRVVKGFVNISIDPYDFLTSGTNMHGWSTCQKLYGDMAGGVFSWLTDPNALIAFRDNGKVYTYDKIMSRDVGGDREVYDFGANKFAGNSKSWRQIINCDVNTCTFLFGREYPQNKDIEVVFDATRELLEDVIGKYVGVADWDNYGDLERIATRNYFGSHPVYKDVYNHHYSDIGNWESLKGHYKIKKALISPTGTDMAKAQITAGGKTYCLLCGREIDKNSNSVTCGRC